MRQIDADHQVNGHEALHLSLGQCGACPAHFLAFCQDLEDLALSQLAQAVRRVELGKGQVAVEEGSRCAMLLTVIDGVLRLSRGLADGRRQITGFRFPGDLVIGPTGDQPWPVSVQAVQPATLCQLGQPELLALRGRYPALNRRLDAFTARGTAEDQAHMVTLGRKLPVERLATFLIDMLGRCPPEVDGDDVISLPMTRQDIADYLGLETETVSRLFSRMKQDGVIALPRPSLVVLQKPAALAKLAGVDPNKAR